MKLYIFNPDVEMALANNTENYIPPASIRRLADNLAMLPIWYAQPGSMVLAAPDYNQEFLLSMKQLFGIQVELVGWSGLRNACPNAQVVPWGWSPTLRRRLLDAGIRMQRLPTPGQLTEYRNHASRETDVFFGQRVESRRMPHTCGNHCLVSENGLKHLEQQLKSGSKTPCVFKALWSSSGRGLRWCRNGLTKSALDWCRSEVREHGMVIMEPVYDKVEDFAMEFFCDGQGQVLFSGYSSFDTNEKGAYRSNILTSDVQIESWLCRYVSLPTLIQVREQVQQELELCYAHRYAGPIGIDMMVCRKPDDRTYAIYPHVEVNLRMTMGMVARYFYDRFVTPSSEGRLYIETYPSPADLQERATQDHKLYPLNIRNGRIVAGCMELVPVTPRSVNRAYAIISPRDAATGRS